MFTVLEGESTEGKAIKGYQTQRHWQLHRKLGQVPGKHRCMVCPLLKILLRHQVMAAALLLEAGQQVGQTSCLAMSALSGFPHHDPHR